MLCSISAYSPPIKAVIIPSASSITPHHSGGTPPASETVSMPYRPTFITTVENSAAAGALARREPAAPSRAADRPGQQGEPHQTRQPEQRVLHHIHRLKVDLCQLEGAVG